MRLFLRQAFNVVTAIGAIATGFGVIVAAVIGVFTQKVVAEPWLALLIVGTFLLVSGLAALVLQSRFSPLSDPGGLQTAPVPVAQAPEGAGAEELASAASRPREYVELDPSALIEGWSELTTAQQDELVRRMLGKWARIHGTAEDVWSDPPAIIFVVTRKIYYANTSLGGLGGAQRLNIILVFESEDDRLLELGHGDSFEVQGIVAGLERNPFGVPQLVFRQCEWLK